MRVNKRKQKRRLKKTIVWMRKDRLSTAWRNIFVKAGILED